MTPVTTVPMRLPGADWWRADDWRFDALVIGCAGLAALLVWAAGRWRRRFEDRRAAELERRRAQAAAEAVAGERVRLARELHDIVAHAVSVMLLQAAGARTVVSRDPDRADRALANVEEVGQQAMAELRRLLVVLRSASGEDADEFGNPPGPEDLPELVRQYEAAGLRVALREEGPVGTLAPSVGLAAYRLVQEALTNAVRHGGKDTWVDVRLRWQLGRDGLPALAVDVEDRPPGPLHPPSVGTGLGLLGLRERVAAVGGGFEAGAMPSGGFAVRAVLPATALPRPEESAVSTIATVPASTSLSATAAPFRRIA